MPLIRYLNRSPPSLAIWTWFLSLWIWSTLISHLSKNQRKTTGFTQLVAIPPSQHVTINIPESFINFSRVASRIKSLNLTLILFTSRYTYWKQGNFEFDGFRVPWKFIQIAHIKNSKIHSHINTTYHYGTFGNFTYKSKRRIFASGSSLSGGTHQNFQIPTSEIWNNQILNFLHTYTTYYYRIFGSLIYKSKTILNVAGSNQIGGIFDNLQISSSKIPLNHTLDSLNISRWILKPAKAKIILERFSNQIVRGICFIGFITPSWISLYNCVQIFEIDLFLKPYILCKATDYCKSNLTNYNEMLLGLFPRLPSSEDENVKKRSQDDNANALGANVEGCDLVTFVQCMKQAYDVMTSLDSEMVLCRTIEKYIHDNKEGIVKSKESIKRIVSQKLTAYERLEMTRCFEDWASTIFAMNHVLQGVVNIAAYYCKLIKCLWIQHESRSLGIEEGRFTQLLVYLNFNPDDRTYIEKLQKEMSMQKQHVTQLSFLTVWDQGKCLNPHYAQVSACEEDFQTQPTSAHVIIKDMQKMNQNTPAIRTPPIRNLVGMTSSSKALRSPFVMPNGILHPYGREDLEYTTNEEKDKERVTLIRQRGVHVPAPIHDSEIQAYQIAFHRGTKDLDTYEATALGLTHMEKRCLQECEDVWRGDAYLIRSKVVILHDVGQRRAQIDVNRATAQEGLKLEGSHQARAEIQSLYEEVNTDPSALLQTYYE